MIWAAIFFYLCGAKIAYDMMFFGNDTRREKIEAGVLTVLWFIGPVCALIEDVYQKVRQ